MNKACRKVNDALSLYIDNQLDKKQIKYIENHLETCLECRRQYELLSQTVKELNLLQNIPLPENFAESLHLRLANENMASSKNVPGYIRFFRPYSAVLAGILMVVLAAAGYYNSFWRYDNAYIEDAPVVDCFIQQSDSVSVETNDSGESGTIPQTTAQPANKAIQKSAPKAAAQPANGASVPEAAAEITPPPEAPSNDLTSAPEADNAVAFTSPVPEATADTSSIAAFSAPASASVITEDSDAPQQNKEVYRSYSAGTSALAGEPQYNEYVFYCRDSGFLKALDEQYDITPQNEFIADSEQINEVLSLADEYGATYSLINSDPQLSSFKCTVNITDN